MKFTFLGTGTSQGVPVIGCKCEVCTSTDKRDNRLRTSAMLQSDSTTIVFDSGPDFRQQMLRAQVSKLDAIVFTHQHKDHTAGLDDVRAFNFLLEREMDVYADLATLESLKREYAYIFAEKKYPGIPKISLHEIRPYEPFQIGDIQLTPIEVMHHKLPVLGFRHKNMAYITDANFISEKSQSYLQGLEILILNALRKQKHISHFSLEEAIETSTKLKPRQAYFTHISHLLGRHADVNHLLPYWISLAEDGLVLEY